MSFLLLPMPDVRLLIAHEFGHVAGSHDENHRFGNNVYRNENPVRKELGLPSRPTYAGYPVPWHEEF